MPLDISESRTPTGNKLLLVQAQGVVTGAQAQVLVDDVATSGPHAGWPIFCKIAKGTEYTPEARKTMTAGGSYPCCAILVTSAVLKTLVNFMMRVTGSDPRARMFATEAEALAWVDQVLQRGKP